MRALLAIVVPLALPTAFYVLYMTLARRGAGDTTQPKAMPWSWLVVAGGILAVIAFLALYLFEDAGRGKYHPARIIDGKIQPGYFGDQPN